MFISQVLQFKLYLVLTLSLCVSTESDIYSTTKNATRFHGPSVTETFGADLFIRGLMRSGRRIYMWVCGVLMYRSSMTRAALPERQSVLLFSSFPRRSQWASSSLSTPTSAFPRCHPFAVPQRRSPLWRPFFGPRPWKHCAYGASFRWGSEVGTKSVNVSMIMFFSSKTNGFKYLSSFFFDQRSEVDVGSMRSYNMIIIVFRAMFHSWPIS